MGLIDLCFTTFPETLWELVTSCSPPCLVLPGKLVKVENPVETKHASQQEAFHQYSTNVLENLTQ